jgi:SM-20-related protein
MKPVYRYTFDGRQILVFDRFFKERAIRGFANMLDGVGFHRLETDNSPEDDWKSFSRDFAVRTIESHESVTRVHGLLGKYFPEVWRSKLYRAYTNLGVYGDMYFPHRDSDPETPTVTALYYANATWERAWGGETIFFNDRKDAVVAVNPRPGRLVLFDGAIEHRSGSVSRICNTSRFTLALKFRGKEKNHRPSVSPRTRRIA